MLQVQIPSNLPDVWGGDVMRWGAFVAKIYPNGIGENVITCIKQAI